MRQRVPSSQQQHRGWLHPTLRVVRQARASLQKHGSSQELGAHLELDGLYVGARGAGRIASPFNAQALLLPVSLHHKLHRPVRSHT
eukprot:466346-Rhodomonas_salina.2